MQYRNDPKSGNALSILGFGCMRFPRSLNTRIDMEKTENLIRSAIESGVNYFDTAYIYGGSETALGEILHKLDARKKVYIATKLPHQQCARYEDFDRLLNEQLSHLQTDYIDYYLIHNISSAAGWQTVCGLGIEKWIKEKKAAGVIKQLGFSFHGAQNEFMALLDAYDWDFCQIQYNYMNEHYQAGREGLIQAHKKGLPVIIMEPLLGGKLAGGLPPKALDIFKAADNTLSPAARAMKWLYDQPQVTVVLSGMNSGDQLLDNLKSAEDAKPGMLSEKERALYTQVLSVFKESYKIPCTGCNYCMPCKCGVNIPGCFAAYNTSFAVGYVAGITQYLTGTGLNHPEKNNGARNCKKCGQCEKHCPQHISIIKELETVSKKMEPVWLKPLVRLAMRIMNRRKPQNAR